MLKKRGKYLGQSRTTKWRRSLEIPYCNCEYHSADHQEDCHCKFHQPCEDSDVYCTCPYHAEINNVDLGPADIRTNRSFLHFNVDLDDSNPNSSHTQTESEPSDHSLSSQNEIHLTTSSTATPTRVSCGERSISLSQEASRSYPGDIFQLTSSDNQSLLAVANDSLMKDAGDSRNAAIGYEQLPPTYHIHHEDQTVEKAGEDLKFSFECLNVPPTEKNPTAAANTATNENQAKPLPLMSCSEVGLHTFFAAMDTCGIANKSSASVTLPPHSNSLLFGSNSLHEEVCGDNPNSANNCVGSSSACSESYSNDAAFHQRFAARNDPDLSDDTSSSCDHNSLNNARSCEGCNSSIYSALSDVDPHSPIGPSELEGSDDNEDESTHDDESDSERGSDHSDPPSSNLPLSSDEDSHASDSSDEDSEDSDSDPEDPDRDPDDPDADPEDPDEDPDDPHEDPEDPDDTSDSDPDGDVGNDANHFTLENESLNELLAMIQGRTRREVIALVVSLSVRSSLDYETVIKIFGIMDILYGRPGGHPQFPTTKKQLWRSLNKNAAGIRKHAYCSGCFRALGFVSQLPDPVVCQCGVQVRRGQAKYFITLNVRKQLERILNLPGAWERLQYRETRHKSAPEAMEDILDGQAYEELRRREDGASSPYDYTYQFNLDGFNISKSSSTEAWPIFLKINEFPPNIRQKNVILAGLWVDKSYVKFNLFLKTFIKQANKLSTRGITWRPHGGNPVVSRFFPTCCCADAVGRCGILNMAHFSGNYGCTFCNHVGVKLRSMKYPIPGTAVNRVRRHQGVEYNERIVIPQVVIRTDNSIKTAMQQVRDERIEGVIGPSAVMLMSHFDLGLGFSTDDLHPLYKGVTMFHTELLLKGITGEYEVTGAQKAMIDRRLVRIKTPTHISRKPRSISTIKKWKGTEFRNWLLYFCVPCLQGVVPVRYLRHLGLFSKAVFLLSRDVIFEEDLVEAERCLHEYVHRFQEYFGPQNMRFNVHVLTHVVPCVRSWGPLWAHSTFFYESWNHRLGKTVTSPRGAIDQMVTRYLMASLVESIPYSNDINEDVKDFIEKKVKGSKMKDAIAVGDAYFFAEHEERVPTQEEQQALVNAGYECQCLTEFLQVIVRGVECRSVRYPGDGKSLNNIVYTTDDCFARIDGICVLDGNDMGGLFVTIFEVGDPLLGVSHIVPIENMEGRAFIPISSVRNLAMKILVGEQWYVTPMSNQAEID